MTTDVSATVCNSIETTGVNMYDEVFLYSAVVCTIRVRQLGRVLASPKQYAKHILDNELSPDIFSVWFL